MGAKNDDRVEAKPDSTAATVQAVIHVAEETSFVHFYLACGHLITIKKGEMPGKDARLRR